jgi:hypothetical protein
VTVPFLYRWTPGGFGYYRRLRRYADPAYDWEHDRDPVRLKHRRAEHLTDPDTTGFVKREYTSYGEYVLHQRQKFDELLRLGWGFSNATVSEYRRRFYSRFRYLVLLVPADAIVVCLAGVPKRLCVVAGSVVRCRH